MAPNPPQQSASCAPAFHLAHKLMVPEVAALRPPPPGTSTYCEAPLKASAPPTVPVRSTVGETAPLNVPLVPRKAVAFPSNGQYDTKVAAFSPGHERSSNDGSFQLAPGSTPLASCRHRASSGINVRETTDVSGKLRLPGVPPMTTLEVQFSARVLRVVGSRLASVAPDPSAATGHGLVSP